jgi:hypothetical protein
MSVFHCQSKKIYRLLWLQHTLEHKTTYCLHILQIGAVCNLPEQFHKSCFYVHIFCCFTFFWLRSALMDLGVLYFKLTWKCQVLQQLLPVRNILSSSMPSFSWNDCGLCCMPGVHLVAMLITCSIITYYTEWKLLTHMQFECKRKYIKFASLTGNPLK